MLSCESLIAVSPNARCLEVELPSRFSILFEYTLFGKLVSAFSDIALAFWLIPEFRDERTIDFLPRHLRRLAVEWIEIMRDVAPSSKGSSRSIRLARTRLLSLYSQEMRDKVAAEGAGQRPDDARLNRSQYRLLRGSAMLDGRTRRFQSSSIQID